MAESERCDLAVWDLGGSLLGETRRRLQGAVRREGPRIATVFGEWQGRRIALGCPQPVIAKQAPSAVEALNALVAAHHPTRLLIVGPAATNDAALRLGSVLIADVVIDSTGADPRSLPQTATADLPRGAVGVGRLPSENNEVRVTTDWAGTAAAAIDELGVDAALLAVVTTTGADPPVSRRPTPSRQAGRFLGKLLKGSWRVAPSDETASKAVANAIRKLLEATP